MNELDECLRMLDYFIEKSQFAMFTGVMMGPDDYRKLRNGIVALVKRIEALEEAQRMREGEL
jgi:hypothetical protein